MRSDTSFTSSAMAPTVIWGKYRYDEKGGSGNTERIVLQSGYGDPSFIFISVARNYEENRRLLPMQIV
jgi:hypothetical protein